MLKHGDKIVDTIWIHCSATRPEWLAGSPLSEKVKEITRWHVAKGWATVGYHWIIDRDGTVAKGRDEGTRGAHVANHNIGSIGICLIGGHGSSENGKFLDSYTPEQENALRRLIDDIRGRAQITKIRGHNEVAAKACPGFNVKRWLEGKPAKKKLSESSTMQASAVQMLSGAAGGVTAISALDGNAQIVVVVLCVLVMAAAAWVMRERIARWVKENGS
jgi:N-acetyl-anhydromuramyl-L-alanine amidase AmpD